MRARLHLLPMLCLAACAPEGAGRVASHREPIIGGSTDPNDPAVVMLVSYPPDLSTYFTCTASFIAPTVLLTAAHCVDAAHHANQRFGVFLGADASAFSASAAQLVPQLVPAVSVHPHPQYDPNAPFFADIATVVLGASPGIAPLPIQRGLIDGSWVNRPARLVGYGQAQVGVFSVTRREVGTVLQAVDPIDTITVGDPIHHSCVGDSGGPALVDVAGVETLVGVDSYTDLAGCLDAAHYRRTDVFISFIDAYLPVVPSPDLSAPPDLAPPMDLTPSPDLRVPFDLGSDPGSGAADLAWPDFAPSPGCDLAGSSAATTPWLALLVVAATIGVGARARRRH